MGQYYFPALIGVDSGELLVSCSPHTFDNGAKLTEHSYYENGFVEAVLCKIASYDWVRVAWIGDYAEMSDLKGIVDARLVATAMTSLDDSEYRLKPDDPDIRDPGFDIWTGIVYNRDKRQKLSLPRYLANVRMIRHGLKLPFESPLNERVGHYVKPYWMEYDDIDHVVLNPVPLLTAIGNGRGGGDYEGTDMGWVGAWALDPITIAPPGAPAPDDGEWEDVTGRFAFEEGC